MTTSCHQTLEKLSKSNIVGRQIRSRRSGKTRTRGYALFSALKSIYFVNVGGDLVETLSRCKLLNSALHRLASIMRKQRRCSKVGKGFDGMHQRLERQLVHFTVSLPIENSSFLNSVTRLWMREVPAIMEVRIERSHVNSH